MIRISTGANSMPPTTTMASGFCTWLPMPVETAAGSRPIAAMMQVMKTGRICVSQVSMMARVRSIPFSTRRANYLANLKGMVSEPLTDSEMAEIAGIDRNCRLIKGQVFLWKDEQTWEDLWDLNGEVTPP